MNTAVGNQSVNLVDLQQQSIAGAFWASLQSLFGGTGWLDLTGSSGTTANSITASNTSDGAALVTTGNATATGLASSTEVVPDRRRIGRRPAGRRSSPRTPPSTNGGLAIANSGGNAAAGLLALNAVVADQWAGLGAYLSGYLAQLGTGSALAAPSASSWALGDVLVDLFGEIHADEVLIDGFGALSGGRSRRPSPRRSGSPAGFDATWSPPGRRRRAPHPGPPGHGDTHDQPRDRLDRRQHRPDVDGQRRRRRPAGRGGERLAGVRRPRPGRAAPRSRRSPAARWRATPRSIPPTWRSSSTPPPGRPSSSPATPPRRTPP